MFTHRNGGSIRLSPSEGASDPAPQPNLLGTQLTPEICRTLQREITKWRDTLFADEGRIPVPGHFQRFIYTGELYPKGKGEDVLDPASIAKLRDFRNEVFSRWITMASPLASALSAMTDCLDLLERSPELNRISAIVLAGGKADGALTVSPMLLKSVPAIPPLANSRIYINCTPAGIPEVAALLLAANDRLKQDLQFKYFDLSIPSIKDLSWRRSDRIVAYVHEQDLSTVLDALTEFAQQHPAMFADRRLPLFVKEFHTGIGVAEEPKYNEHEEAQSFAQSRAEFLHLTTLLAAQQAYRLFGENSSKGSCKVPPKLEQFLKEYSAEVNESVPALLAILKDSSATLSEHFSVVAGAAAVVALPDLSEDTFTECLQFFVPYAAQVLGIDTTDLSRNLRK